MNINVISSSDPSQSERAGSTAGDVKGFDCRAGSAIGDIQMCLSAAGVPDSYILSGGNTITT